MPQVLNVTRHERIALVSLNNPPVNALSHAVRLALTASLKELFAADDVDAIVIVCEGRTFIAGADIREFGKPPLAPDIPELVEFLDGAPKATIAAIHGTALGGGLELALACHFRIATENANLGLPEVTLGILPGAGGTQRLPRLVGPRAALELVVTGAPISAAHAQRIGLIDGLVTEPLAEAGLEFARRVISERRPRRRVSELTASLDDPNLFASYERSIEERSRGFLAPFRCLEAIRGAIELPFNEGLELERRLFRQLIASPESRAQRHVFFGEREVAKVPGLPDDTPTRPVKTVAVHVVDARAAGLVRCFADARIGVTLLAATQEQLDSVLSSIRGGYAGAVARGLITQAVCEERLARIRPTLVYDDARSADLLLDAATDDWDARRATLTRLDSVAKPGAILATSTALLDLERLAQATSRPVDVVGMHFSEPIERAKLLEAVRGPDTAADAYSSVMKLGRSLGKIAVPLRGAVASRLSNVLWREALFLLEEGATPEQVDHAMRDFGFVEGPCEAMDVVGIETAVAARRSRLELLGPRERACNVLELLGELGRRGKENGTGFYRYDAGRAAPDPVVRELLERHSASRGIARRDVSGDEILGRCLYGMINEAARALDDGVAARPLDIDMVSIHGAGFPTYRGGLLFFADELGLSQVRERISRYAAQVGEEYWTLASSIERLAADGGRFYRGRG
jgi:3-hydroxyacyl-CoA dehydrogenase